MKDIHINIIVQSLEMEDRHILLITHSSINTAYDNFIIQFWDIIQKFMHLQKSITTRILCIHPKWGTQCIFPRFQHSCLYVYTCIYIDQK